MNDGGQTSPFELSASGERRRQEILTLAVREAGTLRRRRAARRVAIGAAMVIVVAAGVCVAAANRGRGRVDAPPVQAHGPSPEVERPRQLASGVIGPPQPRPAVVPKQMSAEIVIDRVPTDQTLARQLALPHVPSVKLERLSDDALLRTLADAGTPASLTYVGGRASVRYRQGVR
jgi:hypothetical protein